MKPDYVTKMVVLSNSSPILPSELALRAYEVSTDAIVKETCFGLMVTGDEKVVNELITELRKLDPSGIFVKDRGFQPGDSRRCRAVRGGGPRPGFHQLEKESEILPSISRGLETINIPAKEHERKKRRKFTIDDLMKTIKEEVEEEE